MKNLTIEKRKVVSMPVKRIPKIGDRAWGHFLNCDFPIVCDAVIPHVSNDGHLTYECHYTGSLNDLTRYYHVKEVNA